MNRALTYIVFFIIVSLIITIIIFAHFMVLENENIIKTTITLGNETTSTREKMILFKNISLHFGNLMNNSYYMFTHNGLKYIDLPPYVPDYPGYPIGSIKINESFHNKTLYIVLRMSNVKEYGLGIVIKHSKYSYSYKGAIVDNETYIRLDPPEKYYGEYIIYLRGFIYIGNKSSVDIRLYIYLAK